MNRPLAICMATCIGLASTGFARITNYWVGASGNWSDVSKWYQDSAGKIPATRYPGQDPEITDDTAWFIGTSTGTITVDKDVTIYRICVNDSSKESSITFESSSAESPRTIKTTSSSNSIHHNNAVGKKRTATFRNIVIEGNYIDCRGGSAVFDTGADIKLSKTLYAWASGRSNRYLPGCKVKATFISQISGSWHVVEGGELTGSMSLAVAGGGFRILGGVCSFSSITVNKENCTVEIGGGDVTCAANPVLFDDTTFIFTNGTLTVGATTTDPRLLGTGDAVFRSTVAPTSSNYKTKPSINVFTNDGDVATFSGTIFATNGTYSAFHFTNSVTVNANVMNLSRITIAAAKDVTINANRINLGVRIFPTLNGPALTIPYGTTFGAFDDWYVHNKTFTLYLNGDIYVDTTDCFDGATPRTIGLYKAYARPSATLNVRGCGTLNLAFSSNPNAFRLRSIDVADGATLGLTSNGTSVVANQCRIGAGSSLRLKAGTASFDVTHLTMDPTATVVVEVPDDLAANVYPVFVSQDADTSSAIAAATTLVGDGAVSWTLRSGLNTVYLHNGVEPTYGEIGTSNIWIGAVNGDWSEPGNWARGVKPTDGSIYFGGTRNMCVTNGESGTVAISRLMFFPSCGPIRLSGGKFSLASNGYRNVNSSPIFSQARVPVIIESDLTTANALSVVAADDSFVELDGTTTVTKTFRPSGDVRVGGTLTAKSLLLEAPVDSGRATKLQVLAGGKVSVTAIATNQVLAASRYVVDGGGTLEFLDGADAVCGHFVTMNVANIDGLMDVKCPYLTTKPQTYYGTGTVQIASTRTHAKGSGSVIIGCGLTLKPASWSTVTADAPGNYIKIAVTNDAVLSAAANWTYGPEAGVATTTTVAERALEIAERATLTVKTEGHTVSFADPIVGTGSLVVAEGSSLALAGDLLASARGDWTTFATVGSWTCAAGVFPSNYGIQTVDNGDGTVDVQAKLKPGTVIVFL